MGSLSQREAAVKYILTGFGRFHRVENNPTKYLAEQLLAYQENVLNEDTTRFYDCRVLKVSTDVCDDYLQQMGKQVSEELAETPVVWINLGVDLESKDIAIECRAINNATFSSPDEDGNQFVQHAIDADIPYDLTVSSKIDVDAVINRLSEQNIHIKKSFDAELMGRGMWYAVFIHVPEFQHVSKEKQLQSISALADAIGKHIHTPAPL